MSVAEAEEFFGDGEARHPGRAQDPRPARRRRARLPQHRPAADDAVRRRAAAAEAGHPDGREGRRLRPRRADHRPPPRRRRAAARPARPAGRLRQVGDRHRAPPGGDGARRLDHRPRPRRRPRRRPRSSSRARPPTSSPPAPPSPASTSRTTSAPERASAYRIRAWLSACSSSGRDSGGLELATMLSEGIGDEVEVTLIDKSEAFVFGFSKLDVMFGRASRRGGPPALRRDRQARGAVLRGDGHRDRPRGAAGDHRRRARTRPTCSSSRSAPTTTSTRRPGWPRRATSSTRSRAPSGWPGSSDFLRGPRGHRRLRGAVQVPAGAERVRAAARRRAARARRARRSARSRS